MRTSSNAITLYSSYMIDGVHRREGGHDSGTEEEWIIAEGLYKEHKIRNIALFFKNVDPGKLSDPGDQLKAVLACERTPQ